MATDPVTEAQEAALNVILERDKAIPKRYALALAEAVIAACAPLIRRQAFHEAAESVRMELRNYGLSGSYEDATFDNALLFAIDTIREAMATDGRTVTP